MRAVVGADMQADEEGTVRVWTIPIIACCAVLVAVPQASAHHKKQTPCGHLPTAEHQHHFARDFGGLAKRLWPLDEWRDEDPRSGHLRDEVRHRKRCASSIAGRKRMTRKAARARHRFKRHRRRKLEAARSDCIPGVTVYSGGGGCWAIPASIVACESGYSWSAYNPSGARGPYQFLGWPVPWPVDSVEDKRAHHRMAAQLYAGGAGRGHWVC